MCRIAELRQSSGMATPEWLFPESRLSVSGLFVSMSAPSTLNLDNQVHVVIGLTPSRTASALSQAAAKAAARPCCKPGVERINDYRLDVAESLRRASFLWRLVSSLQRGDTIFHVIEFLISSSFAWVDTSSAWVDTSELTPI